MSVTGNDTIVINAVRAFIRKSTTMMATIIAASLRASSTLVSHFSMNHVWRNISSWRVIHFGRSFCISASFSTIFAERSTVFTLGTFDIRMMTPGVPSMRASPRLWLLRPTSTVATSLRTPPSGSEVDPIFSIVLLTGLRLIGNSEVAVRAIPAHPGLVICERDDSRLAIVICLVVSLAGSTEIVYWGDDPPIMRRLDIPGTVERDWRRSVSA